MSLAFSYLYRPTPVLTLGALPPVHLGNEPVFRGYLAGLAFMGAHAQHRPGRSHGVMGDPWIHRSGPMRSFQGLGQDGSILDLSNYGFSDTQINDVASAYDSGALSDSGLNQILSGNVSPGSLGDFMAADPGATESVAGAGESTYYLSDGTTYYGTPQDLANYLNANPQLGVSSGAPGGSGATGAGIPATSSVAALVAAAAKALSPTAAIPAGYVRTATGQIVPASQASLYGGVASTSPFAFLSQSTLLPGTPNSVVIFGGLAILLLLPALMGKK